MASASLVLPEPERPVRMTKGLVSSAVSARMVSIEDIFKLIEGLAEFETAAAPQRLGAQTLGTLQIFARTLGVSASISPWLARYASSQGAANGF